MCRIVTRVTSDVSVPSTYIFATHFVIIIVQIGSLCCREIFMLCISALRLNLMSPIGFYHDQCAR